jgi:hypothetical protein
VQIALPAFTIYGAASDTKIRTLSCFIPSGHNVNMALSNAFAMVE